MQMKILQDIMMNLQIYVKSISRKGEKYLHIQLPFLV